MRHRGWAAAVVLTGALLVPQPADAVPIGSLLTPVPLSLADTADLWDLGITDLDGDGIPDLYSTNHNARQDVMTGDGALGFTDVVTALGLDQDPSLPGAELPGPPASTAAGGLYLWREGNDHLAVHASVDADVPAVDVTLSIYGAFTHVEDPGVDVTVTASTDGAGRPISLVRVTATTTGTATLDIDLVGTPTQVDVAAPADTTLVSIGPGALHPSATEFDWRLQDRHGIAWADLDGDGDLDAFVVRGGLKGQLGTYAGLVSDELFRNDGGHLTDVTAGSGIVKGDCRGRAARWVDVDADGNLDLEVTCDDTPPQLWLRTGPFTFRNVSSRLPDGVDATTFLWLDVSGDRRPELIGATADGVDVYTPNSRGRYVLGTSYPSTSAPFSGVALTDRDGNGAPDLYFASGKGSMFLSGRPNGTFRVDDPTRYGLPAQARRATFVDVDRDGRTDLVALPGGVYRGLADHTYRSTALLRDAVPTSARAMTSLWFDGDGDGDPDTIVGYATAPGAKDWDVRMYGNDAAPSHWLALDLVGPVGNRPAIGATVTVVAGGVTTHHWVGEADTATYSQGQYRIDVSLGRSTATVDELTVTWPDGSTRTLSDVAVDRRLVVHEAP